MALFFKEKHVVPFRPIDGAVFKKKHVVPLRPIDGAVDRLLIRCTHMGVST
jgi:hypothetical protein